jgi:formate C-acetyltransferase
MDPQFEYLFTDLRKTHNQGVFDVYSPEMMRCRKSGVLTGCRTATDAGASSVTIAAWRCTASAIWCASVNSVRRSAAKLERGEDLEADDPPA